MAVWSFQMMLKNRLKSNQNSRSLLMALRLYMVWLTLRLKCMVSHCPKTMWYPSLICL